jgi:hypothetical protein
MAVPLKHTWHPVITLLLNHLHGQVSKIFLLSENTEKGKIAILVGQPIFKVYYLDTMYV